MYCNKELTMLTNKDKAQLLRDAVELMEQADALVQKALGDSDSTQITHESIEDVVVDLMYDIAELEGML
jgi:hypothetical protein